MKRLNSHAVQYFGLDLHITMPWIAVDKDGWICEFEEEPIKQNVYWQVNEGDYNLICKVDLDGLAWKETKREFVLGKSINDFAKEALKRLKEKIKL